MYLIVLGFYEYLERLEGKIRDGIFFCVNKSDNYSVHSSNPERVEKNSIDKSVQLFSQFFQFPMRSDIYLPFSY